MIKLKNILSEGRKVTSARRKHAQNYVKKSKLAQAIDVDEKGFKHRHKMVSSTWKQLNKFDPIPSWLRKYAYAAANKYIAQTGEMPPGTGLSEGVYDHILEKLDKGDTVVIPKGIGYDLTDPIAFRRSDGNVKGVITAVQDGQAYIKLDNGRQAKTRADLLQKESKTSRLGGRYGGEPDMAIADPGADEVPNPIANTSKKGGAVRTKGRTAKPRSKHFVNEQTELQRLKKKVADAKKAYKNFTGRYPPVAGMSPQAQTANRELNKRSFELRQAWTDAEEELKAAQEKRKQGLKEAGLKKTSGRKSYGAPGEARSKGTGLKARRASKKRERQRGKKQAQEEAVGLRWPKGFYENMPRKGDRVMEWGSRRAGVATSNPFPAGLGNYKVKIKWDDGHTGSEYVTHLYKIDEALVEAATGPTMAQIRKRLRVLRQQGLISQRIAIQLRKEFPDADDAVIDFLVYTTALESVNEADDKRYFVASYRTHNGKYSVKITKSGGMGGKAYLDITNEKTGKTETKEFPSVADARSEWKKIHKANLKEHGMIKLKNLLPEAGEYTLGDLGPSAKGKKVQVSVGFEKNGITFHPGDTGTVIEKKSSFSGGPKAKVKMDDKRYGNRAYTVSAHNFTVV